MQEIQKWRDGVVSVLISTTAALVGVENKNCRQIIVTGMLYSISNLVQAIGRLRIEQCGPDTIVTQYIGEKECGEKEQHVQDSKQKLKNLQNMFGEFDNAELAKEAEEILTINGYRMWLETSGCMIANLERILSRGQRLREPCGRCTNCKAPSSQSPEDCTPNQRIVEIEDKDEEDDDDDDDSIGFGLPSAKTVSYTHLTLPTILLV